MSYIVGGQKHYYYGTAHSSKFFDCENKLNLNDKISVYKVFRSFYETFIKKGNGVILSEFGWTDRTNLKNLAQKAKFFIETANKFGIPCIV